MLIALNSNKCMSQTHLNLVLGLEEQQQFIKQPTILVQYPEAHPDG